MVYKTRNGFIHGWCQWAKKVYKHTDGFWLLPTIRISWSHCYDGKLTMLHSEFHFLKLNGQLSWLYHYHEADEKKVTGFV